MTDTTTAARRVYVTGVVQGVGFRPFIYGLAQRLALTGWVRNTSAGVEIEVEAPPDVLDTFVRTITTEAPPLSRIDAINFAPIPVVGFTHFVIQHSEAIEGAYQPISPDMATCDDCLNEIFNPDDRRYRYAFTNCTNCGPRFTIIQDIPYDRPLTTMSGFIMCPECQGEYVNPLDRRFHAQPNACPVCGPQLELCPSPDHDVPELWDDLPVDEIAATRDLLRAGQIVAIKGLGGFHVACDATNNPIVQRLRARKGRPAKPFALMMFNLETVMQFCHVSFAAAQALSGCERPIVLLRLKPDTSIAAAVAPGLREIGVMLPHTPLHHLLLERADDFPPALVMTSGNFSDEPIITSSNEALDRLGPLVDAFLVHNRPIHLRCDDSVVRAHADFMPAGKGTAHTRSIMPLRRSRGYAPYPIPLVFDVPPLLATGAELKNTFCLARERNAFMSQHVGDLSNFDSLLAYQQAIDHLTQLFRITPELIAHDLHPDYMATRYALQHPETHVGVQHHHAHLASCLAEHKFPPTKPAIGIIFDGTGLGTDNAIWGGEVLIGSYASYARFAHMQYIPLPGGDAATLRPYRTAVAHLWCADIPWEADLAPVKMLNDTERPILQRQLERQLNAPLTSSMGRLFDAVASLTGVLQQVTYEAQGAIWLEAQVDPDVADHYPFAIHPPQEPGAPHHFDPAPLFRALLAELRANVPLPTLAARFHNGVAHLIRDLCRLARENTGISDVVLSGGVFQNSTLLQKTIPLLQADRFTVYTHQLVPPNDGGLALGQAAIAGFRALNGEI